MPFAMPGAGKCPDPAADVQKLCGAWRPLADLEVCPTSLAEPIAWLEFAAIKLGAGGGGLDGAGGPGEAEIGT
jgi:hypothetical protein